jgi:hypothetical protein
MNIEYYHFPPKNFTPYDIREMQDRVETYLSWKRFYEDNPKIENYNHVIKFWYFLDNRVEVGEIVLSTRFAETTIELMEAVQKTDTFCMWLPPHYKEPDYEAY